MTGDSRVDIKTSHKDYKNDNIINFLLHVFLYVDLISIFSQAYHFIILQQCDIKITMVIAPKANLPTHVQITVKKKLKT